MKDVDVKTVNFFFCTIMTSDADPAIVSLTLPGRAAIQSAPQRLHRISVEPFYRCCCARLIRCSSRSGRRCPAAYPERQVRAQAEGAGRRSECHIKAVPQSEPASQPGRPGYIPAVSNGHRPPLLGRPHQRDVSQLPGKARGAASKGTLCVCRTILQAPIGHQTGGRQTPRSARYQGCAGKKGRSKCMHSPSAIHATPTLFAKVDRAIRHHSASQLACLAVGR